MTSLELTSWPSILNLHFSVTLCQKTNWNVLPKIPFLYCSEFSIPLSFTNCYSSGKTKLCSTWLCLGAKKLWHAKNWGPKPLWKHGSRGRYGKICVRKGREKKVRGNVKPVFNIWLCFKCVLWKYIECSEVRKRNTFIDITTTGVSI